MTLNYVLDTYAVMAWLMKEPGHERVHGILRQSLDNRCSAAMSVINLGEIAYIVQRRDGPERAAQMLAYLDTIELQIVEATRQRVLAAANLKAEHAISYADAFAAALAIETEGILVTGDAEFRALEKKVQIEWLTNL